MNWCFAKINNRLGEIYFERKRDKIKILGHCYIKAEDYKTKKEQAWIKADAAKFLLSYKNNKYKDKLNPSMNFI